MIAGLLFLALFVVQVVFVTLKAVGTLAWDWGWVLLPAEVVGAGYCALYLVWLGANIVDGVQQKLALKAEYRALSRKK